MSGGEAGEMIYSALFWIITGADLWQDTSQQLPTGPGPKPEGWKLRCTGTHGARSSTVIDTVPKNLEIQKRPKVA